VTRRPTGPAPDAFVRICPSRDILARMGEKWTSLALVALKHEPMRFGALLRRLEGISQKMLSQTLRSLERDGLVTRTVRDLRPLSVEYALTQRAADLVPIVEMLKAWAETHLFALAESNAAYDTRNDRA
jgi:DNA-binding HxlR family transcriptional regulator